jgi:hypothetical protein
VAIVHARDNSVESSLGQVKAWNTAYVLNNDLLEAFRATMAKEQPRYLDK